MNFGPLTIMKRMHSNGTPCASINVASWHNRRSLTWRWSLTKSPWYKPPGTQGFSFMRVHRGQGFNFMLCFNSRFTGHWNLTTQPSMWVKR